MLGLQPLGLNDALAMPMADAFDPAQAQWSYRAEAAEILRSTQLPIPPARFQARSAAALTCRIHDAAYWAAAMKGQDFSSEDRLDTDAFNAALWRGLGTGAEPDVRNRRDLGEDRLSRLQEIKPARCAA